MMRISSRNHAARVAAALLWMLCGLAPRAAVDPASLPAVGFHPGGLAYWDTPYFANALAMGGGWSEYADGDWGTGIPSWGVDQFDAQGFPRYLNPGRKLRAVCYGLHSDTRGSRPAGWPDRSRLARGRVVLTWRGTADIRVNGGAVYLAGESSGPETGTLADGRRVYRFENGQSLQWIEVHAIDPAAPVTDIKAWLPDPADPAHRSLENQMFHPIFLDRLRDADWGFIRFMDWLQTNGSPQRDWADRRVPAHCFMGGTLNPRPPAEGTGGDRGTGVALEMLPALCNASGLDLWICVPHLATDDYIHKLARLIRYGSDGVEPYAQPVADPVWPPLAADRRVYLEYSNEIWSGGGAFAQGDWAAQQAALLGIGKPQFNARRFCEVWRIFQEEFGGDARLVRVAAVFTAGEFYTRPFLQEMAAYGPTLNPPVAPDVIAVTTYFGNGIQDWVYDRARAQAGSADPWFMTGETFDAGGGNPHPVTLPIGDPYWTSPDFERHLDEAFAEWTRRLLSGDAREGAGPDAVGIGGGYDAWLAELARTAFPAPRPIVAYEGGPSIYTDNIDWGDARDDGTTIFMEALNRHPAMAEVYGIHLNMARARGLRSHVGFTAFSAWGKYGQWGHLEYLDQPLDEGVKYRFLLDWIAGQQGVRPIDDPAGAAPRFETSHTLPVVVAGVPYSTAIRTAGGDGARHVRIVGLSLVPGLHCTIPAGPADAVELTGTPAADGVSYLYLRVTDADGDPAWRTFTLRSVGGPGTLIEADLQGSDPALHRPWTAAYVKAAGLGYSGIDCGAGAQPGAGAGAWVWSVNAPADEAEATLARAIENQQYLTVTVAPPAGGRLDLRGARLRFAIRRIDYHAPRRYALLSSLGGFTADAAIFTSPHNGSTDDQAMTVSLPDTPGYGAVAAPIEFRIYGFSGQYGGHKTSLIEFKLNGNPIVSGTGARVSWNQFQ